MNIELTPSNFSGSIMFRIKFNGMRDSTRTRNLYAHPQAINKTSKMLYGKGVEIAGADNMLFFDKTPPRIDRRWKIFNSDKEPGIFSYDMATNPIDSFRVVMLPALHEGLHPVRYNLLIEAKIEFIEVRKGSRLKDAASILKILFTQNTLTAMEMIKNKFPGIVEFVK